MDSKLLRQLSAPRSQRLFNLGLCLFFVALSVQYTFKVTEGGDSPRSAFLRWRGQILDLDRGVNIYDVHNYPNPPIMAMILEPLAALPPLAGSLLWFYLKVGMALLVFRWVFAMVEDPERPFPAWAKMATIVLAMRPVMGDLSHGNVNVFILFLVVGALRLYSLRRDLGAGLVLGLSIACKVTPALFIPYLLWKRSWKALGGCAAGLALFLVLIPGLALGQQHNAFLLGRWTHQMIVPFVLEGEVTPEHQNQSLPGLLHRLATHSASFSEYDGEAYVPVEYHNLADVDPGVLRLLLKLCLLGFAGLVVWAGRTPPGERSGWRACAEFSVILLGMLLFSERTWKHHCVTLVLPFAVLVYALAVAALSRPQRRYVAAALVAAVLLMASTSTGAFGPAATRLGKLAQVYGAYVWAHMVLLAAVIYLLRSPVPSFRPAPPRLLAARVLVAGVLGSARGPEEALAEPPAAAGYRQ